jgi:hypothetical protein
MAGYYPMLRMNDHGLARTSVAAGWLAASRELSPRWSWLLVRSMFKVFAADHCCLVRACSGLAMQTAVVFVCCSV